MVSGGREVCFGPFHVVRPRPAKQSVQRLALLGEVQRANRALYRAFLLKEELVVPLQTGSGHGEGNSEISHLPSILRSWPS